jgi:murein DD-endopeptidase MepM/ murein hydrolase activator NlpD
VIPKRAKKRFRSSGITMVAMLSIGFLAVPMAVVQAGPLDEPLITSSSPETSLLPWPIQGVIDAVTGVVEWIVNPSPSEPPPPTPEEEPTTPPPSESGTAPSGNQTNPVTGAATVSLSQPAAVGGVPQINMPAQPAAAAASTSTTQASVPSSTRGGISGPSDFHPSGPRSTVEILRILGELKLSSDEVARILAPFPVLGLATYSDDWGAPRHIPTFHLHEGTDIFAARGTPVIASDGGQITRVTLGSEVGGNVLRLTASDGTYYIYSHLDQVSPYIKEGGTVLPGATLGSVGTTGNAEGGVPHLHFEIHPDGGAAVPPVPYLDRWLSEALATAQALAGRTTAAPAGQPSLAARIAEKVRGFNPAPSAHVAGFSNRVAISWVIAFGVIVTIGALRMKRLKGPRAGEAVS